MRRLMQSYHALSSEEKAKFVLKDQVILKSMRLSFLWALIKVQLDAPYVVVMGLIGAAGFVMQAAAFCFTRLFNLVH